MYNVEIKFAFYTSENIVSFADKFIQVFQQSKLFWNVYIYNREEVKKEISVDWHSETFILFPNT